MSDPLFGTGGPTLFSGQGIVPAPAVIYPPPQSVVARLTAGPPTLGSNPSINPQQLWYPFGACILYHAADMVQYEMNIPVPTQTSDFTSGGGSPTPVSGVQITWATPQTHVLYDEPGTGYITTTGFIIPSHLAGPYEINGIAEVMQGTCDHLVLAITINGVLYYLAGPATGELTDIETGPFIRGGLVSAPHAGGSVILTVSWDNASGMPVLNVGDDIRMWLFQVGTNTNANNNAYIMWAKMSLFRTSLFAT